MEFEAIQSYLGTAHPSRPIYTNPKTHISSKMLWFGTELAEIDALMPNFQELRATIVTTAELGQNVSQLPRILILIGNCLPD